MSMLKEERKALRDEFERTYGIHLLEDDELLPIIQFICDASKLADLNTTELKKLVEEMKGNSEVAFGQYSHDYKNLIEVSRQLLAATANESKSIFNSTRRDLEALPKMVNDFKGAVNQLKIPTHVTLKRISFEENTMSFLWKFFTVSILAVTVSIIAAIIWVHQTNEENIRVKTRCNIEQHEWLLKYYDHMKHDAPGASQKFINGNPIPSNKIN
jgi:hypothetical protein